MAGKNIKKMLTLDRTHAVVLQGSIHTTMPNGNTVELLYTEYLT